MPGLSNSIQTMESTTENSGMPEKPVNQSTENMSTPVETPAELSAEETNLAEKKIEAELSEPIDNVSATPEMETPSAPADEVQEETIKEKVVSENPELIVSEDINQESVVVAESKSIVNESVDVTATAPEVHPEEEKHLKEIAVHHEEIEAEPVEQFGTMSKDVLLERMKVLCQEADVNNVKNRVQDAKDAFQLIINHERDAALALFLENGGIREEFDYKDPLEEPFFDAYKNFQKRRSEFVLGQEKIRQQNLKAKNEILAQMKNILQQEEDMSKAFNEFHELQAKWRGIGPVPPQNVNDLWMTYKLYCDRFYEFIKINRELQDLEMKKNLEMKMHLCERAEEMLLEPSLNKALQEIQTLQHKWREIGAVPREKRTEIWVRFKAAVDKVYENKRGYLDSMKHQFDENLAAKTALIEKAEALVKEVFEKHPQWQEGLKQLLEIQADWRKIGPAGKEQNDSIWHKFKATCDQFFKNKDLFYKKKKQEYATNLQAKTELCIQAEALKESEDWKSTGSELIRLQQEWKKIGPAGDRNEKIWQRFKVACDEFFQRKTAHFADQDKAQEVNLVKKNELIANVESFVFPEDPNESLDQLKAFQRQFTETGLVPMANKEDIQQRFRAAIQKHFDALKLKPEFRQSFNQREHTERNDRHQRPERNDRPSHGGSSGGGNDEQRNLLSRVNQLNSEVQVWENNLGFFAKSKNANTLKQEYEQKIQEAKNEIAQLKTKLKDLRSA
jgi:hypothetical protein